MIVAKGVAEQLEGGSWIRRMFEEGARLRQERGAENVFDFTLGNPEVEPPPSVLNALRRLVDDSTPGRHCYMPNAGLPAVRAAIAAKLARESGLPFAAEHVLMTVGAAGACNVIFKAVLDPGDEVIALAPFFPEYRFYVGNHGGRLVVVQTDANFLPDVKAIAAAVTPRTRAIIVNTPNNPTGRVYPASVLHDLQTMLAGLPHPVLVVSDEPYKMLVYDGGQQTDVSSIIRHTVICNSWSKSQALAGERIGCLALSPHLPKVKRLAEACAFANRVLGFVNASALWQRVVGEVPDACVDVVAYQDKRDLLCESLARMGYEVAKPEGTFYVFMKTPVPDDVWFVHRLAREGVLAVPGTGFGRPGYMRLSLTVPGVLIERSLVGFEKALRSP
jgi:aspartate aminotransferase